MSILKASIVPTSLAVSLLFGGMTDHDWPVTCHQVEIITNAVEKNKGVRSVMYIHVMDRNASFSGRWFLIFIHFILNQVIVEWKSHEKAMEIVTVCHRISLITSPDRPARPEAICNLFRIYPLNNIVASWQISLRWWCWCWCNSMQLPESDLCHILRHKNWFTGTKMHFFWMRGMQS